MSHGTCAECESTHCSLRWENLAIRKKKKALEPSNVLGMTVVYLCTALGQTVMLVNADIPQLKISIPEWVMG